MQIGPALDLANTAAYFTTVPILPFNREQVTAAIIGDKQMRLVIDGFDVDYTFQELDPTSRTERFLYIQSYLDYYTAEDIKGIEVMYSKKYNTIYNSKVLSFEDQKKLNIFSDIAYLEITTRSGHGPFMKAKNRGFR